MISIKKQIVWLLKGVSLLATTLILPVALHAEEPDTAFVNSVIENYKKDNAVYLTVTRHLIIECINGKLVAHTEESLQKLMLTDIAPSLHSREDLSYTYVNDLLTMPTGTAYVPHGTGYKRIRCTNFGAFHPTDEGVFYDDNKGIAVLFSGLTKRAVTETNYSLGCSELSMLPRLFLYQDNLPIAVCNIEITVPNFVEMGFDIYGNNTENIVTSSEAKNGNITYRFVAEDVKALKPIAGVPSALYFLPHILPYIKTYTLPGDHRTKNLNDNIDGLYKYMYKFVHNINVAHDKDLENTVERLTKNDATPRQKATHIYDWVQKNMHYVAFEDSLGGFYPRQAGTINERKFGDCKDMTSLLVAMFRKAGLNAYFTWIGTRHLPYTTEETPVPLFDHMICTIKIDNQWIFVDGTDPVIPFGKYPDMDQGKDVLIAIDPENYELMKVPVAEAKENTTSDSTEMHVISNKSITGSMQIKYTGSMAERVANILLLTKNEQRDRIMRLLTARGTNKYLISKYDAQIEPVGNKNASINAQYNIHDYIQKVKGQYIVNMNLKRYLGDTYIDTKGRNVAYYFNNKEKIKETVVLELPKGSRVVHLPSPAQGNLSNVLSYKITYKVSGRNVILEKEYELKARSVTKKEFAAYNKLIENLRKQYKESVVLTAK